jgi:PAS domain S-box-containing protein
MEDKHAKTNRLSGDQIRVSEDQLRLLFKSIPIPAYAWQRKGDDFILVDYNDAAKSFTGDKVVGLLRLNASELYRDEPLILTEMRQCFKEKSPITREMDFNLKSTGARKFLNAKYIFVPPDLVIVLTEDLTISKQEEDLIRYSENKYRRLFENSILGISEAEPDGRLVNANAAYAHMYGYDNPRQMLAEVHNVLQLYAHPEERKSVLDTIDQKGIMNPREIEVVRYDGTKFWVLVSAQALKETEGVRYQGIHLDITERKKLEEELRLTTSQLQSTFESIEDLVTVHDRNLRVVMSNWHAREYVTEEERRSKPYCYVCYMHRDKPCEICPTLEVFRTGQPVTMEVNNLYSDRMLEVSAYPITDASGNVYLVTEDVKDITERKRVEEALKQSEEKYRLITQNMSEMVILMDLENRLTFISPSFERIRGFTLDEMNHLQPEENMVPASWALVLKSQADLLRSESIDNDGFPISSKMELKVYRKDGSTLWVEDTLTLLRKEDGMPYAFMVISREITERKNAEQALAEEVERRRSLFEQTPIGIVIIDPDTARFLEFNTIACQQLGYTSEEFEKLSIFDLEAIESSEETKARMLPVKATRGMSFETHHRTKQGKIRDVLVTAQSVNVGGHNVYQCIWQDITERKHADEENRSFREKAELSSRLAAVGEMVAGIAHEINNPLTGVVGFSELLMEENLPQEIKAQLKIIFDGSHQVKDIVKRLLTFSRQSKPVKACTNINELIDATLDLRRYVLRTSNIEVITRFDPDLHCAVADSGQLQEVFLNLIVNAEYSMKKAHDKGVLTITTQQKDDHISISFKDDGMGMSEETKGKLFNPFYTTKDVHEGTGLGLSLSRSIILEHCGTIDVNSEPGNGATFVITLPFNPTADNAAIQKLANARNVSPENFKPARILVVDDEEAIRKLLSTILVQNGHTVDFTGDFLNVFENLRTNNYDAILMDIRMPGMSGIKLYKRIIKACPGLVGKFIFIAGDTSDTGTRAFLDQNNLSYISKPFARETVTQKVNEILCRT